MSNKTRLQTNNTNLQALIDKANALPEAGSGGGSGGGGSVETCTVTIVSEATDMSPEPPSINAVIYTAYDGIAIYSSYERNLSVTSYTIENVVCGSTLMVRSYTMAGAKYDSSELVVTLTNDSRIVKITANSGETATITIQ